MQERIFPADIWQTWCIITDDGNVEIVIGGRLDTNRQASFLVRYDDRLAGDIRIHDLYVVDEHGTVFVTDSVRQSQGRRRYQTITGHQSISGLPTP